MYLSNKDLYYEIVVSKAQGKLTKKAEKMLQILGNRIISKMYYTNIDDKNDCLHTGLLRMYSYWYKFDEERFENAFAYFTEVFKRGMAQGFNTLKSKTISIDGFNNGEGSFNF